MNYYIILLLLIIIFICNSDQKKYNINFNENNTIKIHHIKNSSIIFNYISSIQKCNKTKFMYYIPNNPYIVHEKVYQKYQDINQIKLCKSYNIKTLYNIFDNNTINLNNQKILKHGCKIDSLSKEIIWWVVILKNNIEITRISSCLDVQYEVMLNINNKKNITLKNTNIEKINLNNINFNIHINPLQIKNQYNFKNKCIFEDIYRNYGIINNCNNKNSITLGKIGEINCPTAIDAYNLSNKCNVAHRFTNIILKRIYRKNTNKILEKYILPRYDKNTYLNYSNNHMVLPTYFINYIKPDVSIILDIKKKTICDIIINNKTIFLKTYEIFNVFSIVIRNNINSIISFKCNDNNLVIQNTKHIKNFNFHKLDIYFLHFNKIFNTKCNILCNNIIKIKNIKIISNNSTNMNISKNNSTNMNISKNNSTNMNISKNNNINIFKSFSDFLNKYLFSEPYFL